MYIYDFPSLPAQVNPTVKPRAGVPQVVVPASHLFTSVICHLLLGRIPQRRHNSTGIERLWQRLFQWQLVYPDSSRQKSTATHWGWLPQLIIYNI